MGRRYSKFIKINHRIYLIFKYDILDDKNAITLCRFRTVNHNLPIESERWRNAYIPRENRKCNLCDSNDLGDEFHYLFKCSSLSLERTQLIKPYYRNRPNVIKFNQLMSSKHVPTLNNLCKFIRCIVRKIDSPG